MGHFAGVAFIFAQAAQPLGPGSKGQEWCFDRGQGARLCEATEAECNRLRGINTEAACNCNESPTVQRATRQQFILPEMEMTRRLARMLE